MRKEYERKISAMDNATLLKETEKQLGDSFIYFLDDGHESHWKDKVCENACKNVDPGLYDIAAYRVDRSFTIF